MDEDLIDCPFNKLHRIIRHKLPYHIVKCEKNYCGPKLETCTFNAMHRFPVGERTTHLEDCEDYHRIMAEEYLSLDKRKT